MLPGRRFFDDARGTVKLGRGDRYACMKTAWHIVIWLAPALIACGGNQEVARSLKEINLRLVDLKGSVENLQSRLDDAENKQILLEDRVEKLQMGQRSLGLPADLPVVRVEQSAPVVAAAPVAPEEQPAPRTVPRGAPKAKPKASAAEPEPRDDPPQAESEWTGESGVLGVWQPDRKPASPPGGGSILMEPAGKPSREEKRLERALPKPSPEPASAIATAPPVREAPPAAVVPALPVETVLPEGARPVSVVRADGPMDLYKAGYKAIVSGSNEEGRQGLFAFLLKYPKHELADNALYWIGESYYAQQSWSDAIRYFQRVMDEYPECNKVPDAMVKAALTLNKVGEPDQARFLLAQVVKVYPGTPPASVARKRLDEWSNEGGTR
jgi:tol-pal system protein YbgF